MDYKDDEAERLEAELLLKAAGGKAKNWPAKIFLLIGLALGVLGAFIPTENCADGCSIGPNFGLIGAGLLVIAIGIFVFAGNAATKSPLIVGGILVIWVAIHLFALAANAWVMIILIWGEIAVAPFVLVGGLIVAAVVGIGKSRKKNGYRSGE